MYVCKYERFLLRCQSGQIIRTMTSFVIRAREKVRVRVGLGVMVRLSVRGREQ